MPFCSIGARSENCGGGGGEGTIVIPSAAKGSRRRAFQYPKRSFDDTRFPNAPIVSGSSGDDHTPRQFCVYILASKSKVLYTGLTGNLVWRVAQHKAGTGSAFCAHYRVNRLVYFDFTTSAYAAITREKQIKSRTREKKIRPVASVNPRWRDLSKAWDRPAVRR